MTKQDFKILEKHYDLLYSVAKTLTLISPDFNVLDELYAVYQKLGYRPQNLRCNECRIGMLLTLWRIYEENKGQFEKPEVNESKSKAGRKVDTRKGKGTKK